MHLAPVYWKLSENFSDRNVWKLGWNFTKVFSAVIIIILFIYCIQVQWPVKLQFAQEVTCGMHYLHTRTPPVVHGDLKLQNVLIGDGYKAKVNDRTLPSFEL